MLASSTRSRMSAGHDAENQDKPHIFTSIYRERRVVFISLFIAFAQFQWGYDLSAASGFQSIPGFLAVFGYVDPTTTTGYNLRTSVQTLIQSFIQLGGLIACIFIFKFGTAISNRQGIWIGSVFSVVAAILQITSTNLAALYVGRILLGVSTGFYMTYSATYMGEIAPTHVRGSIIGLAAFQTSFGSLIGVLVDNFTTQYNSRISYQIPLTVMLAVSVTLAFGLIFLPESPRHYIRKNSEEKAKKSIRILRGTLDDDEIATEVSEIKETWLMEMEMAHSIRLIDAFRARNLKRTILSICCSIGQTGTGVVFFTSFSAFFYADAGVSNQFLWIIVSQAVGLTGCMVGFFIMRFVERRTLLVVCSTINAFIMIVIAAVYTRLGNNSYTAAQTLVAMGTLFNWVYGMGQGPVLWALTVEIPVQHLRSKTVGLATGGNYVVGWLATYCTPYFINTSAMNWGPKYCYIWGASNLLIAVWAWFTIPNVNGQSLEDITNSMTALNPGRDKGRISRREDVQQLAKSENN
ncbi:hypothetical protein N7540_002077 [Penicillium herquei]|nr:hypothetical protein N7540_002077 [Penicillium herquei]